MKIAEVKLEAIAPIQEDKTIAKELKISLAHKEGDRYFVAKEGRKTLAIAIIRPMLKATFPWQGEAAEIKCLYVYPEYRQVEVGSELLRSVMGAIACPLKATILPSTEKFYQKHGFRKVFQRGQYPVYATQVTDELCIQ